MALSDVPVVTSALDAIRALRLGQQVAFPGDVADQLALWGFTISPLPVTVGPVDHGRVTLATDIMSGLGQDFTINAPDPVQTPHDENPRLVLPALTVFLTGPLSGMPGDGTLLLIARLNPDGTAAYTNPLGVPPPSMGPHSAPPMSLPLIPIGAAGLAGFGQLAPEQVHGGVVMATIPLSTAAMQAVGGGITAGQIVAFSDTMAGKVLGMLPFVGGPVSTTYSGAKMVESPRGANIVQFIVDAATGGAGIAGMAARIVLPGLATAQVIADFAAGDARSLWQAAATLLTAPLAILYGPAGAAAQGAARFLAGKAYDWFREREINAAADDGMIAGTALMAGDPIGQQVLAYNAAQEQAVLQRLASDIQVQQAQAAADQVFGNMAASEAQQANDIRAYAAELATYTGMMPDPQEVADGLGVSIETVAAAMGVPSAVAPPMTMLDISLGPIEPGPEAVAAPEPVPGEALPPEALPPDIPSPGFDPSQPELPPAPEAAPPVVSPGIVGWTPPPEPPPAPRVSAIPCSWNTTLTCLVYFGSKEYAAYVAGGGTFR